jgi:predicted TIM-barrel fold metal-dependent hydrolase
MSVYRFVDMDNHFYETDDCFSRHIEAKYRDLAIRPVPGGTDRWTKQTRDDVGAWALGDQRIKFADWNLSDVALKPGTLLGVLEGKKPMSSIDDTQLISPKRDLPEALDKQRRLEVMDAQNIQAAMMVPSSALLVEHDFQDRPDVIAANFRSFNRWVEEDWGFGADGRIFSVPMISLLDVAAATAEAERLAAAGARFFYMKMGPVNRRSPAHPDFDPFWAQVEETGLRPVLHLDNHGYIALVGPLWGESPDLPPHLTESAFLRYIGDTWQPVQHTLAALILQDLFGRFPKIEVLVIECGSEWVATCLNFMDKAAKSAAGPWTDGKDADGKRPSDLFREHVSIAPFPEDDIPGLARLLGAERVLFGSDWPHSEGLTEPGDFMERLPGLSDDDILKIMRLNGARLLDLDPSAV